MPLTIARLNKAITQQRNLGVSGIVTAALITIGIVLFVQARSTNATLDTSRFVPVSPQRIVDSRPGAGPSDDGVEGAVKAGDSFDVQITGRGGVPASDVTAVVLNVTITDASRAGYVQVYPTRFSKRGTSSNLNVEYAGQTIANQVTVRVGARGKVTIYMSGGGQVLADVFGYYTLSTQSTEGRYTPLLAPTPRRVVDTRDAMQVPVADPGDAVSCEQFATWDESWRWFWRYRRFGDPAHLDPDQDGIPCNELPGDKTSVQPKDLFKLVPGDSLRVPVLNDTGLAGGFTRPGRASAVVANITVTGASGPGFWQVVPTGEATLGSTSVVNIERVGQTIANQVIVPVGKDGTITIYSQSGGHVIVDVAGVFTGTASPSSTYGLFVPINPSRLVDTRDPNNTPAVAPMRAGRELVVQSTDRFGIPTEVSAIALNATATEATEPGFVQVFPSGGATPGASSTINVERAGETVPNAVYATVDGIGQFSIFTQTGADLIADVAGWFTSAPLPRPPSESSAPVSSVPLESPGSDTVGAAAPSGAPAPATARGTSPAATSPAQPTTPPPVSPTGRPGRPVPPSPSESTTVPGPTNGPGTTAAVPGGPSEPGTTTVPRPTGPPTTPPPPSTRPPTTPPPTTPPVTTTTAVSTTTTTVPDTTTTTNSLPLPTLPLPTLPLPTLPLPTLPLPTLPFPLRPVVESLALPP